MVNSLVESQTGHERRGGVEADSTQKSGQCFFGSRGYWTSTKQDVLEAWLYLATFHFLPAMSKLDSLRQFTLKVWIYTCERLPVTTTEHQTPARVWTSLSQTSLMFFCDHWLVFLPGSLVQQRVVFFPSALPFPFHVPFPSFSWFKIDYGPQMGGLKLVWNQSEPPRGTPSIPLWLYG